MNTWLVFTCPTRLPCLDIAPQAVVDAAEELLQLHGQGSIAGTEAQEVN